MEKYLLNLNFLEELFNSKVQKKFVSISLLNFQEEYIQEFAGMVTSGNISLDGNSAVRRTLQLNFVVDKNTFSVSNLKIENKKIEIKIGIENTTSYYPELDIVWFKMGKFVCNSFSPKKDSNGLVTVSLGAIDKMAKLNGLIGGNITAATTFHKDADENPVLIYDIVYNLVKFFGNESTNNIIINDLSSVAKQELDYKGKSPLYFELNEYGDYTGNIYIAYDGNTQLAGNYSEYYEAEDTVGYQLTDFTYPGELVGDINSSATEILDKIKNTLGNYEYFYDLDGRFIFQEIKNYLNTSQSRTILNLDYNRNYVINKEVFSFKKNLLIQSPSETIDINSLKNDFILWGTRTSSDKTTTSICYHLAIDHKPTLEETGLSLSVETDWREIMYQLILAGDGASDYEMYSTEMKTFWRDLYSPYLYFGVKEDGSVEETPYRTVFEAQENGVIYEDILKNDQALEFKMTWEDRIGNNWTGWNPDVILNPSKLNYWIDFIDDTSVLGEYSVKNIGRRSYCEANKDVSILFNKEVPDVVFLNVDKYTEEDLNAEKVRLAAEGTAWCQYDSAQEELYAAGGQRPSAFEIVREWLYKKAVMQKKINLTVVPLYFLEPNNIIEVYDEDLDISNYYLINSISISLGFGDMMSIEATKLLDRI